jgi:hypothetical protein
VAEGERSDPTSVAGAEIYMVDRDPPLCVLLWRLHVGIIWREKRFFPPKVGSGEKLNSKILDN